MKEFPIIEKKRFWPFRLNELIDLYSYQVQRWSKEIKDEPSAVADEVIKVLEYPMHHGKPDNTHIWNAYHGEYKRCYRRNLDFWQKASESSFVKIGNCEDGASVCTALEGLLVESDQTYAVLGVVRDACTEKILGGHAWNYTEWDDEFHLIETTLDRPPERYPIVENIREPYKHRRWIYDPYILFNWKEYEEIGRGMADKYIEMNHEDKETRSKYEAIEEAFEIPTKPIREAGFLSRFRWRK